MKTHQLAISVLVVGSFLALSGSPGSLWAQSSLQDIATGVSSNSSLPQVTIYTAKEIVTLDAAKPKVEAVAVKGDRIVATGSLAEIKLMIGDNNFRINEAFHDQVIVPGLIGQHDHPLLTALTMVTEIIAIEDWTLPSGVVQAANNREEYFQRITQAEANLDDPNQPLITWGFHHYFHGKLTREDLNQISRKRPILVWHRSCHEFIFNDAALEMMGIDEDYLAKQTESARSQSNLAEGHFWEQGLFGVLPKVAPVIATPERLRAGLDFMVNYFHSAGVTLGCEPGGILSKPLQDAQNEVLSGPDSPFRFYYIPDGKSVAAAYPETVIQETEKLMNWGEGMTAMVPKQIKLFADGAIYSQLMQLKQPYTDGHEGAWMMDVDFFKKTFQSYWDADYQLHVHVNGDAGLQMVLDTLAENMQRNPRQDHRTVIVHFAVSTPDQVDRIKRLGAIVSANSYYPVALADQYSKSGLGPERADPMTRMGDVERAGIAYSFHSDMPMAPGQPLFLMHCGVNRITPSGRVAAPEQRVSREGALRAVTIEAAYSLQMEDEVGSIEPGKLANFTILADNPVTCDPSRIKEIPVWGTVHEGRVLPVPKSWSSQANTREPMQDQELSQIRWLNAEYQRRQYALAKQSIPKGSDSMERERQESVRACTCGSPLTSVLVTALRAAE